MLNKELHIDDDFRIAGYFTVENDVCIEIYSDTYYEDELFVREGDNDR